METLEYLVFDVYFNNCSKEYLSNYIIELGKAIDYCGYGIVNGVDSYNNAISKGLNHFELEFNSNPDFNMGIVGDIFKDAGAIYVPKEGVTYTLMGMPKGSSIWREDGGNCEGYCKPLYSELLNRDGLLNITPLDNFVILNGFTLLFDCIGKHFVGSNYVVADREITYRNFKDILFANIVAESLIVV